ncbi:hypothetical protein [Microbacterium sp. BK668]|uniref:hypothetical protein n=1 Tax=Microbacterium sp. BK668 TaxID=2512118 RepID=UPI0010E520C2|nr:hypothetical protein [Microbacterium sp. BK668]TDN92240.1 hypothetical protein EV279_1758 [Microbacterium sp. BK668]
MVPSERGAGDEGATRAAVDVGQAGLPRWLLLVGTGEAVGFAVPATVGALVADSGAAVLLLLAAGFVEGVVLGGAQYLAMRRELPALRGALFCMLTGAAAVFAYVCGLLPSSTAQVWMTWPIVLRFAALAVLVVAILGSIGGAQWFELRRHLAGAGWWIVGTALAWLVGLGVFFAIAPPLWHEGQATIAAVGIGIAAGIAMAVAMATVTGITFRILLRRTRSAAARRDAPRLVAT